MAAPHHGKSRHPMFAGWQSRVIPPSMALPTAFAGFINPAPPANRGHCLKTLPAHITAIIASRAQTEWPGDPSMREYLIERQSAAYVELVLHCQAVEPSAYSADLIDFACNSWPDDFEMALHTLKRQLACSKEFFEYVHKDLPADVLQQLKEKTFEEWPGDYEMKLHMLEAEVDGWLAANRLSNQLR